MTRARVLAAILAVAGMSMAAAAYQQAGAPSADKPMVVEVEKLAENLFVLRGGGGNTAVFVQATGVTVVDTKNPKWGTPILQKIRELTDKPVLTIINTHTHGDHVSGNVEFPPSVDVIAHANTRANMDKMLSPPGFQVAATPQPTIFEANGGRGLPKRTFTDRLTVGTGSDRIDLYHFGRGHTNGDAMVVFPSLRVMHMGDLFPGKSIPLMDSNNGGSGVEYAGTLKKVHDGVPDVQTIITGHGPQMTRADLLEFAAVVGAFVEAVRAGKEAGQTAQQIAESWKVPARYAGYTLPPAARVQVSVETILAELR